MVSTRMLAGTLEVTLPATLVVANRGELIQAVEAGLVPGTRRVQLDAAAVADVDTAGLGALARVLRMSLDATSARPRLVNAGEVLRDSMQAALLLDHFDVPSRGDTPVPGQRRAWHRRRSTSSRRTDG